VGGREKRYLRRGPACRHELSCPPGASGGGRATSAACARNRARRIGILGCRGLVAGGRDRFPGQVKMVGTPPPPPPPSPPTQRALASPLPRCLSPSFPSCSFPASAQAHILKSVFSSLRAFLDQHQSDLLQEVEESPIYRWVSFWRNFISLFCRILV
jgi:hypothetical protein